MPTRGAIDCLEVLEPRCLLTSVWAADLAGPVFDADNEVTSAILDDNRIGLLRSEGSGTRLDYFARDIEGSPTAWTALFDHDIEEATFAGDGSLAGIGWFQTSGGHRDQGIGLFAPQTSDPYAVLVADENGPFGYMAGSGLSSPNAFTARMNLVLRDNYLLDTQPLAASDFEVRYMGVAGGVVLNASIVQTTPMSTPLQEVNVVLEVPVVGVGYYRVTLREGSIIDLAGNTNGEVLLGSTYFSQDNHGRPVGQVWTAPSAPSPAPQRPWELMPVISVQGAEALFDGSFRGSSASGSGDATVLVYQTERTDTEGEQVQGFVSWDGTGQSTLAFDEVSIEPIQMIDGGRVLGFEIDAQQGFAISLVMWEGPGRGVSVLVDPDGLNAGGLIPGSVHMSQDGSALVFSTLDLTAAGMKIWFAHSDTGWETMPIFESSQGSVDPAQPLASGTLTTSINGILGLVEGPEEQTPTGGDRVYTVLYTAIEQGNLSEGDPLQGGAGSEALYRTAIMSGQILFRPGQAEDRVISGQPETIAFAEYRASQLGIDYTGLRAGAERAEAAEQVLDDQVVSVGWLNRPINAQGLVGLRAQIAGDSDDQQFAVVERLGLRPLLILPGIFGTMPALSLNPFASPVENWLLNRGVHPDTLIIEPMARTYDDLIASLQLPHVGYTLGSDLFVATYDWRMPPAPVHEATGVDLAAPWQRDVNGEVSGVRINSLGDNPTFHHGIDYLTYWIDRAEEAWRQQHPHRELPSVDIYAHSTGGLVARSYIQSNLFGKKIVDGQGAELEPLPTVNRLISMAVPHEGAPKAWNLLNDNLAIDGFYKQFIGQLVWSAYKKVTEKGLVITSPIAGDTIDTARLAHAVSHRWFRTQAEAFIHMYIPTGRALLATYPFIYEGIKLLTAPAHLQNTLSMDLNTSTIQYLHDRVEVVSFFTTDLPTVDSAWQLVGPRTLPLLDEFSTQTIIALDIYSYVDGYRAPAQGEAWWLDRERSHLGNGDATVPLRSAALFRDALRSRSRPFTGLDHNALNSDLVVQAAVLKELGIASSADDMEEGRYSGLLSSLGQAGGRWIAFWRDPVGAYVTDALGRRSGWSPEHGYLSEIPGTFNYGGSEGWTVISGNDDLGLLTMTIVGVDPEYAVLLVTQSANGSASTEVFEGQIEPGQSVRSLLLASVATADDFITSFRMRFGAGLSDDNSIVQELLRVAPDAAYSRADWTAENYWFQDSSGNVWALWHGGPVHVLPDGQHRWVLDNLSDKAGITDSNSFEPGSMSGVIASWRAFSIQGIADGQLVSLWWSLESGRKEWGNNKNGWVQIAFTEQQFRDPATTEPLTDLPEFRPFTETQSNGRLTFDPRPARESLHGGMSVVLVATTGEVYVATFTTPRQAAGVLAPDRTNIWLLQPLGQVEGLDRFGLLPDLMAYRDNYRLLAGV